MSMTDTGGWGKLPEIEIILPRTRASWRSQHEIFVLREGCQGSQGLAGICCVCRLAWKPSQMCPYHQAYICIAIPRVSSETIAIPKRQHSLTCSIIHSYLAQRCRQDLESLRLFSTVCCSCKHLFVDHKAAWPWETVLLALYYKLNGCDLANLTSLSKFGFSVCTQAPILDCRRCFFDGIQMLTLLKDIPQAADV